MDFNHSNHNAPFGVKKPEPSVEPKAVKPEVRPESKPEAPVMEKEKREFVKPEKQYESLSRYDEIEKLVDKALEKNDTDVALYLNEVTLARNLEEMTGRTKKCFGVVSVVIKSDGKIIKRAGIYNKEKYRDPEDVETIMINEDLKNPDVLTIHRNSIFAKKFD